MPRLRGDMGAVKCGQVPFNWVGRRDGLTEPGFLTAVRNVCPPGPQGYVANDIDLVVRLFGPNYDTDATGRLCLIEFKHYPAVLTTSQRKMYGLLDQMLRAGDDCDDESRSSSSEGCRYAGFYLIQFSEDCWTDCGTEHHYWVNGNVVDLETALGFLCGQLTIESEPLEPPKVALSWAELR